MINFTQTPSGTEPVIVSATFNVPTAPMFKAWTQAKQIMQWFGPSPGSLIDASVDPQVGGYWQFVLQNDDEKREQVEGKYLEVESNQKLVFTWSHVVEYSDGTREATKYSKVTVLFTPVEQKTHLEVRHEAIESEGGRQGVGRGWKACFEHIDGLYSHSTLVES